MMEVDARIAARRRDVRRGERRRRLRRTLTVAALVALTVAGVLLERSSLVALAEVRVTGTSRLDPETVRLAADLPLGTSTLRLRLGAAEERVEALPLVRSATVRRLDPLTVEIAVVERVPELVVVAAGGRRLVDADGVVIAAGEESGLALIELASGARAPEVGSVLEPDTAAGNAFAAWSALPGPLRVDVARYEALGAIELTLHLSSGEAVLFGRAERVAEKARALGAVLEDLGSRSVTAIDVRAPLAPVVIP